MFSTGFWNRFHVLTTYSVEGWHNGFQRSLMCSHPSVWRLIEHLQKEEGLQQFSITHLLAGQTVKAGKVHRVSNERITNIVNTWSTQTEHTQLLAKYYT